MAAAVTAVVAAAMTPKGNSLSTVQYEASENDHNEDRCNSRMSSNEDRCNSRMSSTFSDIDFADYLSKDYSSKDTLECSRSPTPNNIEHDDTYLDLDISIDESEDSEYVSSQDDLTMIASDEYSD